ncbi:lysosomal acid phosphatase-like isoform X2 [Antedon mediterranea]|uniref:lysosomal acid phosphatase-like isoform X2 n=1 Tax=Antedon mediterranea TaxID=105859 RepID=UPI003AF5C7A7
MESFGSSKMKSLKNVLLIMFFLHEISISFAEKNLRQVHVLYRHGNRSPANSYPKDPYNETVWPQGFGMLTQQGMNQHYELGQWLRKRYIEDVKFLQPSYVAKDIVIHSTDTHRTVMSAQSNLAGMFPPSGRQIWDKNLLWQPIGIFTWPRDEDPVLKSRIPCPKRDIMIEEKTKPLYDQFNKKHKKIIDYISQHSGVKEQIHSLGLVADALYFEKAANLILPDWALKKVDGWDGTYYQWTILLKNYQWEAVYQNLSSEVKKLLSGTLVAAIAAHFSAVGIGQPSPKFFMYSAHDTNVAGFLSSISMFNNILPPPASCVIVELYKDLDKNLLTVELLYKNDTSKPPYKLRIGPDGDKCAEQCPIDQFLEYAKSVTPDDFQKECNQHVHLTMPVEWNTGSR